MSRGPGPLTWAAFGASLAYASVYVAPLGAGMLAVVALAAVALFTRQRTGLFPFLVVVMITLFAVGAYRGRVPQELMARPLEELDLAAIALLLAGVLLSCEEGLGRFGYRIHPARAFHVTKPPGVPGYPGWPHVKGLAFLVALALLATMGLSIFAAGWGRVPAGQEANSGYARLGIYAWILGGAVFLAGMVRGFVALRAGGPVRARMLLLDQGWRQLQGPLRLFLRIGGMKRFE